MEPAAARRRPIAASMVVVLPAPLRPSRHTSSPCPTESDTPRRIGLPAISTRRPLISSINARAFTVRRADQGGGGLRVGEEVAHRLVGQHLAAAQADHAAGVGLDQVDVVLDQQQGLHPGAAGGFGERRHDAVLVGGGDAAGGLVEQDHGGRKREGRGDVEQLLLPLRQLPRRAVQRRRQAEDRRHLLHLRPHLAVRAEGSEHPPPAPEPRQRADGNGLGDRQLREHLHELEGARHAEPRELDRADPGDVGAAESDGALGRREQAGQHVHQRGLAGAVRADDRHRLAMLHQEVHSLQRHEVAVAPPDVPGLDQRRRRAHSAAAGRGALEPRRAEATRIRTRPAGPSALAGRPARSTPAPRPAGSASRA